MRYCWLVIMIAGFLAPHSVSAATVTCEVKSVEGGTIVLVNCDQKRAKGFVPGARVKVKLDRKKK